MLDGWEGNRRSDTRTGHVYEIQWSDHLLAQGLSKSDEHFAYVTVASY